MLFRNVIQKHCKRLAGRGKVVESMNVGKPLLFQHWQQFWDWGSIFKIKKSRPRDVSSKTGKVVGSVWSPKSMLSPCYLWELQAWYQFLEDYFNTVGILSWHALAVAKRKQQGGNISKMGYVRKRVRKLGELKDDCKILNLDGRSGSTLGNKVRRVRIKSIAFATTERLLKLGNVQKAEVQNYHSWYQWLTFRHCTWLNLYSAYCVPEPF